MATVTLDELIRSAAGASPDPLVQLEAAATTAAELGELGDSLLNHFVDRCRRSGHTWAAIGEHLGVTRQAAQKRFVDDSGAGFERFTDRARKVVMAAQEIARTEFRHSYTGCEHLLLACYDVEGNLALAALKKHKVTRAQFRSFVEKEGGLGSPDAELPELLPYTPRAKDALIATTTWAMVLGHNYIGCEHLLLGLASVKEGLAGKFLEQREVTVEMLKDDVVDLIAKAQRAKV